jgi:hypothetical protein
MIAPARARQVVGAVANLLTATGQFQGVTTRCLPRDTGGVSAEALSLAELEEHQAWTKIPPDAPYGSEDKMLKAEIGLTREEGTAQLRVHGGDRRSPEFQSYNVTLKNGNSPVYLRARLARDKKTDLLARVDAGELSVRQAAIIAKYIRQT